MKTVHKSIIIEWDRQDEIDTFDHEIHYAAIGTSEDGREWVGTWIETDGEFSDIEDIEENKY